MNQLIKSNLLTIPLDSCKSSISKINISGYSLNNFKTVNPEGYTIICRLGETCDGLNHFPQTSVFNFRMFKIQIKSILIGSHNTQF